MISCTSLNVCDANAVHRPHIPLSRSSLVAYTCRSVSEVPIAQRLGNNGWMGAFIISLGASFTYLHTLCDMGFLVRFVSFMRCGLAADCLRRLSRRTHSRRLGALLEPRVGSVSQSRSGRAQRTNRESKRLQ